MAKLNDLETRLSSRYDDYDPEQDGNKNTEFADLIIDGRSLYQKLKKYDRVPALGWGSEYIQRQMIEYLLLQKPHEYLYYRYPLFVCPWCGDEECGFISVKIDREFDIIIWKDFVLEHDGKKIDIGPFYFHWDNYEQVISRTLGLSGTFT